MFVTEGDMLVAAPPARGAPCTQCGLVLLLCGLLLLRHVSNHLLPSANFGSATVKGSAALFSTRSSHCRTTQLHVKGARRGTDMSKTLAEEQAMRRKVQPRRCFGRMWVGSRKRIGAAARARHITRIDARARSYGP